MKRNPYLQLLEKTCGRHVMVPGARESRDAYVCRLLVAVGTRAALTPVDRPAAGLGVREHLALYTAMVEQLVLVSQVRDAAWLNRFSEVAQAATALCSDLEEERTRTVYVAGTENQSLTSEILMFLPNLLRLIGGLLRDRRVPAGEKVLLALAALYFINPLDLVPDFIPVAGQVDDVIVLLAVIRRMLNRCDPEVIAAHWHGSVGSFNTAEQLLSLVDRMLPLSVRWAFLGRPRGKLLPGVNMRPDRQPLVGGVPAVAACWALGHVVGDRLDGYPAWEPVLPEVRKRQEECATKLVPFSGQVEDLARSGDQGLLLKVLNAAMGGVRAV
ncbi:MAG: YkvA family protein [Bacillota bacterium]